MQLYVYMWVDALASKEKVAYISRAYPQLGRYTNEQFQANLPPSVQHIHMHKHMQNTAMEKGEVGMNMSLLLCTWATL